MVEIWRSQIGSLVPSVGTKSRSTIDYWFACGGHWPPHPWHLQPEAHYARTSRCHYCGSYPGRVRLEADFLLRSDCCSGRRLRQEREYGHLRDAPEYQKYSGGEIPRYDIRLFQWWLIGRSHFKRNRPPQFAGGHSQAVPTTLGRKNPERCRGSVW